MKEHGFYIRPVTTAEIDNLLEVYRDCEDFLAPGLKPKPSREMVLKDLETSKTARGVFCGIYDDSGKLFGVIDFIPKLYQQQPEHAFLSLFMIKKSHRRQGYGAKILESVETQITRDPQIQHLYTTIPTGNDLALHFLTQMGYQITDAPHRDPNQTVYLKKPV